jgi:hypothetical protein
MIKMRELEAKTEVYWQISDQVPSSSVLVSKFTAQFLNFSILQDFTFATVQTQLNHCVTQRFQSSALTLLELLQSFLKVCLRRGLHKKNSTMLATYG